MLELQFYITRPCTGGYARAGQQDAFGGSRQEGNDEAKLENITANHVFAGFFVSGVQYYARYNQYQFDRGG